MKKYLKPEIIFVLYGSIFGLLILFITPPFQVPDEYLHFDYAYAVSIGKLYGSTSLIPTTLQQLADETKSIPSHPENKVSYERLMQYINIPLNPSSTVPVAYNGTAKYNPVPYFPVAISITIARLLDFNPFDLFYFGRIINLFIWILLGYSAIRLLPDQKWTFLLLILTPMSLSEAGSYSADVFTNGISFLWISMCFYFSALNKEELLNKKSRILLIIVASLVSLTKPPYIFLIGLYFMIPRIRFGKIGQYKRNTFLLFGISIFLFLISLLYLRNDLSVSSSDTTYSLYRQLNFLLTNPINFLIIILRSIKRLIIPYWYNSIGLLGWLDTLLPSYIYVTYPLVVLMIWLIDQQKNIVFTLRQKTIALLSNIAALFTIALSLYLTWTPVGNDVLVGFQGRYLIPIFPVLLPVFKNRLTPILKNWKSLLVIAYLFIVLSITIRSIILRYYIA
jgi:uncharacterized membrane protein